MQETAMPMDLAHQRLHSQHLDGGLFATPADVVAWFGAVQAQDYLGALWAVGLRTQGAAERDVEQAIADRAIVRTWPMRGTLHFVSPADVRWMLQLLTPRIVAASVKRVVRQYGLDEETFLRSRDVVQAALEGGKRLTRSGVYRALEAAGIPASDSRGLHIIGWLAQNAVICLGPRQGKQPTFVLLDEWVPASRNLERDEALAELARRYFTAHGPATVRDFAWWSGLTVADARVALDLVRPALAKEEVKGQIYWLSPAVQAARPDPAGAHLLPAYDEYLVGYTDRTAALDDVNRAQADIRTALLSPAMVIDGRVVGTWKRTLSKRGVTITFSPFNRLDGAHSPALAEAAARYEAFLGLPVDLATAKSESRLSTFFRESPLAETTLDLERDDSDARPD